MRTFRSGVASGDVTSNSVVLWTRIDERGDRPTPVNWSIWTEDGTRAGHGRVLADPSTDRTCRVPVDDLEAGTEYHYVFEANGDRAVGRTRTLPVRADAFRIAVMCCSRWGWPGFDRTAGILAESPDLVLHLGDYVYEIGETPPAGPPTDPPHDCHTLDDYRRRYRQHRSDPALQRLHAEVPFVAVWDDHEVADNAPEPGASERRAAGQQAWREWMPTRATGDDPRLDRRLHVDGLLELVLVDSRFGRRPAVDTDGPSTDRPDTKLLSDDQ
ncbi:MAG: alkaline phosphatase D family protein, partial [Acidimicrobiia bacterium]